MRKTPVVCSGDVAKPLQDCSVLVLVVLVMVTIMILLIMSFNIGSHNISSTIDDGYSYYYQDA